MQFGTPSEKPVPINEFVMKMRNCLGRTYTIVRDQLHIFSEKMTTRYDIQAKGPRTSVGHECK